MYTKNYRLKRNGNSANFSRMFVIAKKIKNLIASTLNKITASARCVSSMIVVPNAKLTWLIAPHAKKKPDKGLFFAS